MIVSSMRTWKKIIRFGCLDIRSGSGCHLGGRRVKDPVAEIRRVTLHPLFPLLAGGEGKERQHQGRGDGDLPIVSLSSFHHTTG